MTQPGKVMLTAVACCLGATILVAARTPSGGTVDTGEQGFVASAKVAQGAEDSIPDVPAKEKFQVSIHRPSGAPRIQLDGVDPQGRAALVACSTCHSVRPPNMENVSANSLDEFHLGMTFRHGTTVCYSCHNPKELDALRLADGSRVEFADVMTLCSQCHGPQADAYRHGAHGGMNGFWDLSRGPQTKNNCIDCHDPHSPQYPKMVVGFKPIDRFNEPAQEHFEHEGAESHDDH